MNLMEIDRRKALGLVAAAALYPGAALSRDGKTLYLNAMTSTDWAHGAALFDASGEIVARFELPSRGHGATFNAREKHAVLFARRPGTYAIVIDVSGRRVARLIKSRGDRHFYGHGCFSADGRLLFATENDFDNERGVIGVYDAMDDYRRVGELPSHGIGPHEVVLMPDGKTLAVANGGILTHPSAPRIKLNIAEMAPSLALVKASDGELLAMHRVSEELHKLSIRHLAINNQGVVAAAMQWQGPELDSPPLVGIWSPGEGLRLTSAPADMQRAMRNYCGSVAFAADGRNFIVSSPRGNILTEWGIDGKFKRSFKLRDVCAIAPQPDGGFLATGGTGDIVTVQTQDGILTPLARHTGMMWDNHMTTL
jgi:hypothetical protein